MNKFWQVFLFHFRENVTSRSSIIMSVIFLIVSVGFFGVTHFLGEMGGEGEDSQTIVIFEEEQYQFTVAELEELVDHAVFTIKDPSEIDSATEQVESGDFDELIIVTNEGGVPTLTHIFGGLGENSAISGLMGVIQQKYIATVATENNVSPDVVTQILTPVAINSEPLQDQAAVFGISYIFGFLLYMFLIMYGGMIAASVVSEKSSRVMEVMISKVKPIHMLFAKLSAVLCSALVQLIILVVGFGIAYFLDWANLEDFAFFGGSIDMSMLSWDIVLAFIIFFILGYWIYGLLFAAAASLVSKMEDMSSVQFPITALIIIAFFIMMNSLTDPSSTLVVVSSFIPFFSPLIMFSRFIAGEAGVVDMSIAIAILVGTIALLTVLAGRIYVNGVMFYGDKFKWSQIGQFLKRN